MLDEMFKRLNLEDQKIPVNVKVPNEFYQTVLEELMERDYLSNASNMKFLDLRQSIQFRRKHDKDN